MISRVAALLRMKPPLVANVGLLFSSGPTVPTDGTVGYQTGCIFQHTDGGDGTSVYVNEGSVTSCDFNTIEGGARTADNGITFSGTQSAGNGQKLIDFDAVVLAAGSSNNLWSFGDALGGAVDVTITDYYFPVRMNVASIANPATEKLASLFWLKFATTTAHQANLDIQGIGCTIDIGKNVGYAHAIEGLVDVSASATTTTGTIIGGKFTLDFSSGATLTHGVGDNASAVLGLVTGTGTYAGGMLCSVIEARKEGATTIDNGVWVNVLTGATITHGIRFEGAGTFTNIFFFDGSQAAVSGNTSGGSTLDFSNWRTVKVDVDGTTHYMIIARTIANS